MIFLGATTEVWDELLSGQVGFILATILWMLFYWKVVIPRDEKRETRMLEANEDQAQSIAGLAIAVRLLVAHQLQKEGKNGEEILKALDGLDSLSK